MLAYSAKAVADLEKLYSTPPILEQRKRIRSAISGKPGEIGLDVGCGVAYLACELAREVAPSGHIYAIDNSQASIEASELKISQEGLGNSVEVRFGDAAHLEFPDESFDFVVGAQVYCFVSDVTSALKEACRVLKKGGRLVVLDSDWEMCVWEANDRPLSQRIVAARGAVQFAHANLPRELPGHLRSAGLTLHEVTAYPIIETRYDPNSFSVGLITAMRKTALKYGISASDIATWEEDLRSRTSEGEWFFCLNRFIFVATK